jgi:hypothetical protein
MVKETLKDWGFRFCPSSGIVKTYRFGNWICFRPRTRGWEVATLSTSLERVDFSHWTITDPVSETSRSLEYRIVENVQRPRNPECYTPSSDLSRNYFTHTNTQTHARTPRLTLTHAHIKN